MPWNIMREIQKKNGECVESLYKKEGEVVKFETFEEAENFVCDRPGEKACWYFVVPSEPVDKREGGK